MKTMLQFILPSGGKWVITKTFNDQQHQENFIAYMKRTKGYVLDEVWDVESVNID